MSSRAHFNFVTPSGRRDIFGPDRRRIKNGFYRELKGVPIPSDILDTIVMLPELACAGYLDEEPWMGDVTARLMDAYDDADEMPGAKPLSDTKLEKISYALANGMRLVDAWVYAGYRLPEKEILTERTLLHRVAYLRRLGLDCSKVTMERIVRELDAVAFSQVSDAAEWDGATVKLKRSTTLDKKTKRAIAEVKTTKEGPGVKFHSKLEALRILAQFRGMLKDKVEISGPDGRPIESVAITRDMDPRKAAEAYAELLKGGK